MDTSQGAITNSLQIAVAGYAQLLSNDSLGLTGQADYVIDGQAVSRSQWRKSILEAIKALNQDIIAMNPYFITTKQVL